MKQSLLSSVLCCAVLIGCSTIGPGETQADQGLAQWEYYPAFNQLGLSVASNAPAVLKAPAQIVLTSGQDLALFSILTDSSMKPSSSVSVPVPRNGARWTVDLSFTAAGEYDLLIIGKPASEKGDLFTALARTHFTVNADAVTFWRTDPGFQTFGFTVTAAPQHDVGDESTFSLSTTQDVRLGYSLQDATGKDVPSAVQFSHDGQRWDIAVDFPKSGDYVLMVGAESNGGSGNYQSVATVSFHATVDPSRLPVVPAGWTAGPGYKKYGVSVASAPPASVEDSALIVITTRSPIDIAATLTDTTTAKSVPVYIEVAAVGNERHITVPFPENGNYSLTLFAKSKSQEYILLARVGFAATLSEAARKRAGADRLFHALWARDAKGLRREIESGTDPNVPHSVMVRHEDGKEEAVPEYLVFQLLAPDYLSVEDRVDLLRLLGSRKADLEVRDENGFTPLGATLRPYADPQHRVELAGALLDSGASANATVPGIAYGDGTFARPLFFLMMEDPRIEPVEKKKLFDLFVSHGLDLTVTDYTGDTVLTKAIDFGRPGAGSALAARDMTKTLLARGADPNARDGSGTPVLLQAIAVPAIARELLAAGAAVNVANAQGETPLMECADLFIGITERASDDKANLELMTMLLSRGANVNAADRNGMTPLMELARDAWTPLVEKAFSMLMSAGARVNAQDAYGRTALWWATGPDSSTTLPFVTALVAAGADPNLADVYGVAPRGNAAEVKNGSPDPVEHEVFQVMEDFLKAKGAVDYVLRWPKTNKGDAFKAVETKDLAALAGIPKAEWGKMTGRTSLGVPCTPLHRAVELGDLATVQALCRLGVNWNVGDLWGQSPLHVAVRADRIDLARILVSAGADPNYPWTAGSPREGASSFADAVGAAPDIADEWAARGIRPSDPAVEHLSVYRDRIGLLKQVFQPLHWTTQSLGPLFLPVELGALEAYTFLASRLPPAAGDGDKLLGRLKANDQKLSDYLRKAEASTPPAAVPGEMTGKTGNFSFMIKEWSPLSIPEDPADLPRNPIGIHVPDDYRPGMRFGLLVFIAARPASLFVPPEWAPVVDRRHVIWAAYDGYNPGTGQDDSSLTMAIVQAVERAFDIDPRRVYLGGYSVGGRKTGALLFNQSAIFTGGIAMAGATGGGSIQDVPVTRQSQKNVVFVTTAGDWDYNLDDAFYGYRQALQKYARKAYFIQEAGRPHSRLTAENFDKAIGLLDAR